MGTHPIFESDFDCLTVQSDLERMNVFRLCGDLSHLLAIVILLMKIWKTRSCSGISGKTQALFALVFITRYLDLFVHFVSLYNTVMKIIYISLSVGTCYLIFVKFKATYDGNHDSMRAEFLVVPALGLACLINTSFDVMEVLWTFSIYLESVAILPQLFMISKTGKPRQLHRTICSLKAVIVRFTLPIGFIDIIMKIISILLQSSRVSCRPFFTATSSICTSPRS